MNNPTNRDDRAMASWGRHAWPRRNEGLRIYRERNGCYFLIDPDQKGPSGHDAIANVLTGSEPSLGSCSISREWLYKSGATRVQWSEVTPVWQKAILPWLIEAEPDDDLNGHEMRDLGRYTDTWKSGAIDLEKAGDWGGRGHYRYWVPANPEHKHQDYKLVKALDRGDALCFHVRAAVELEGVKLADCGMGSGLCLVGSRKETEATLAYLADIAHELIDEATAEATATLDRLRKASA